MDREWILKQDKFSEEYKEGFRSFMEVAKHHVNERNETICPCMECLNKRWQPLHATNAQNIDQQESTHWGGAPFIQHALQAAKEGGKPVSFIDNYENMYQDAEHKWVSEAKQVRHEKMKQKREDVKAKFIEEAPEGTPIESIEVALNRRK